MLSAASDGLDALAFNRAPELGTHLLLEFGVTGMTLYGAVVDVAIAPTTKAIGAVAKPQNARTIRGGHAAVAAGSDIRS